MCQDVTIQDRSVAGVVSKVFSSTDMSIEASFTSAGDPRGLRSLMECLYYVSGWHAHSIKKASVRRCVGLKELIITVYSNVIVGKDEAKSMGMPIQKVERVKLFGGLKYVSRSYFLFVLRLEYVFVSILTTEKLAMMGGDLITNVYNELVTNRNVRALVGSFCEMGEADDTADELVGHLVKSYSRMRGKDFVRKYMQHGFKNKNLGKGIRPTLAIISNPEVRRAFSAAKQKVTNINSSTSNDVGELCEEDMHTMMEYTCQLLDNDTFVTKDECNLFQECDV